MAKIPLYDDIVIMPRATPNLVDPTAIENAGSVARTASDVLGAYTELALKHKQALEVTAVNSSLIAGERQKIELIDAARKEASDNPDGFAKAFDQRLAKVDDDIMSGLPSQAAKDAYRKSAATKNLSYLEENLNWENRRKTEKYAESLEQSANNLNIMALRAGREGGNIDSLLRDADASTVAGATFLAADKLAEVNRKMRQGITENWIGGIIEKAPGRAKSILDSRKYDDALGADALERSYKQADTRQKQIVAEAKANAALERGLVDSRIELALAKARTPDDITAIEKEINKQGEQFGEKWVNENLIKVEAKNKQYEKEQVEVADGGVFVRGEAYLNPRDEKGVKAYNTYYDTVVTQELFKAPQNERNTMIADIVDKVRVLPDSLKGDIQTAARSRDPETVAAAADLLNRITARNPTMLQDFNERDVARINMVNSLIESGYAPKEAFARVEQATDPANKALNDERQEALKKAKIDYKEKAIGVLNPGFFVRLLPGTQGVEKGLDKISASQQAQMGVDYKRAYEAHYLLTGDEDLADEHAKKMIKGQYGVTKVNGKPQVMKYAPENYYHIQGVEDDWMREQVKEAAHESIKSSLTSSDTNVDEDVILVPEPYVTPRTAKAGQPHYKLMMKSKESGALVDLLGPKQYFVFDPNKKRKQLIEEARIKAEEGKTKAHTPMRDILADRFPGAN